MTIQTHRCQHGKGEPVHLTVRVDELVAAIQALPCCSRWQKTGRHDPGCWAGCKNAIVQLIPAAAS